MARKYFAEFVGTFALVFAGTGAIIVNDLAGGVITHVGVSLTFGLVVMAMIYAIGDISGAHINPAVTFGFWLSKRFDGRFVIPYILSQVTGAVLASVFLKIMFPTHQTLGMTLPAASMKQSFILEIILTFILVYVILCVSTGSKEKGITAGIAIGAVVGLEALFAGPVSGASMNPARSLGPALVAGHPQYIWIYLLAPTLGAFLSVLSCRCTQTAGCCAPLEKESVT